MHTLSVTKKLYGSNGETELFYENDDPDLVDKTTFSFRLYLGSEETSDDKLQLANMYRYSVKSREGFYCLWKPSEEKFIETGYTDYSAFIDRYGSDPSEHAVINTSMYGAISNIPAGYTVEFHNLLVGTKFKVVERDDEIPKGYTLRLLDGYQRTDSEHVWNSKDEPKTDQIEEGTNPEILVSNQKGWGLTVKKKWTDLSFMASHGYTYFAVYLHGNLVPKTLRRLESPNDEIYYFFFEQADSTFDFGEYYIREVDLSSNSIIPDVDAEGNVRNYADLIISPIDIEGTITVPGMRINSSGTVNNTYTVSYDVGQSTGQNENVRTDTVTNSRPGIELLKQDMNNTPLAGAKFTLKDSSGANVAASEYVSDDNGLITIAYLDEGEYTLTEIEAPQGYIALSEPVRISVGSNGNIVVTYKNGDSHVEKTTVNTAMKATLIIKNDKATLTVKKVDSKTSIPIEGVRFALYKETKNAIGDPVKPTHALSGYENVITDQYGVLPNVDLEHLEPGTYYLEELASASSYGLPADDLVFTIGTDGKVSIQKGNGDWLTRTSNSETTYIYTITVPNQALPLTIRKQDNLKNDLNGAEFVLGKRGDSNNWPPVDLSGYVSDGRTDGIIDLSSTSAITLTGLPNGNYRLEEVKAPNGYIISSKNTYFKIEDGRVTLTDAEGNKLEGEAADEGYARISGYTITVINTPGAALPSTGGPGTNLIYLIGLMLTGIAGAGLVMRKRRRT